ncbi:MAG TPA: hypothetical protein VN228_13505 [Pyrinomonadaceae bacterium]|nr:hypothetical protein [Pyrinomonadaceae bacterium]
MEGTQLTIHPSAGEDFDPAAEAARLEALVAERKAELAALQEEFREFKARYARVVGGPLAELSEVEREIREAEARLVGLDPEAEGEEDAASGFYAAAPPAKTSLRKLFWSVARLFHPDHASDEREAERRHRIMAEASRAYRDGDAESLSTLLGDEQLQFFCATAARDEGPADPASRLLRLREELLTAEFGVRRIRQDRLYHLMLKTRAEAAEGRDALTSMAESITRQIAKARRRLEHLP